MKRLVCQNCKSSKLILSGFVYWDESLQEYKVESIDVEDEEDLTEQYASCRNCDWYDFGLAKWEEIKSSTLVKT